jgi:hypothetical protein
MTGAVCRLCGHRSIAGLVALALLCIAVPACADEPLLRFDVPELPPWAMTPPDGGESVGIVPTNPDADGTAPAGTVRLAALFELSTIVVARRGIELQDRAALDRIGPIAIARGDALAGDLRADPGLLLEEVPSADAGLRMLAAGRVNGVAGPEPVLDALARQLGDGDLLGDRIAVARFRGVLAASAAAAGSAQARALRQAAEALARSGAFSTVITAALSIAPAE